MSREDWEPLKDFHRAKMDRRARRRERIEKGFDAAQHEAAQARMILRKHSEVHYTLRPLGPDPWVLSLYPGSLNVTVTKGDPPAFDLPHPWTLSDVVAAVREAECAG